MSIQLYTPFIYSLTNPRQLWKNVNKILHRSSPPVLPSFTSLSSVSQSFATFLSDKIHKLHTSLLSHHSCTSPHPLLHSRHLLFHPSLVLLLMKFLSFSLSLLTLTVIWTLFLLHFSNNALIFFFLHLLKSSIYLSQLVFFMINSKAAQFILTSQN